MSADIDAPRLREHFALYRDSLRSLTDPFALNRLARNLAKSVENRVPTNLGLIAFSNRIGVNSQTRNLARPVRWTRDAAQDGLIEEFICAVDDAINLLEDFEKSTEENRVLSIQVSRASVLEKIKSLDRERNGREIWAHEIIWTLCLTEYQVLDALEHWSESGALRTGDGDFDYRRVHLTSRGRATTTSSTVEETSMQQTVNVYNQGPVHIQQIGGQHNVGSSLAYTINVEQVLNASSKLRQMLGDFDSADRDEVQAHLDMIDEEIDSDNPRPARLRIAFAAIGRISRAVMKPALDAIVEAAVSGAIRSISGGS